MLRLYCSTRRGKNNIFFVRRLHVGAALFLKKNSVRVGLRGKTDPAASPSSVRFFVIVPKDSLYLLRTSVQALVYGPVPVMRNGAFAFLCG